MGAQPPGGARSARLEPSGFHPKSSSPGPLRKGWSPSVGLESGGPPACWGAALTVQDPVSSLSRVHWAGGNQTMG